MDVMSGNSSRTANEEPPEAYSDEVEWPRAKTYCYWDGVSPCSVPVDPAGFLGWGITETVGYRRSDPMTVRECHPDDDHADR